MNEIQHNEIAREALKKLWEDCEPTVKILATLIITAASAYFIGTFVYEKSQEIPPEKFIFLLKIFMLSFVALLIGYGGFLYWKEKVSQVRRENWIFNPGKPPKNCKEVTVVHQDSSVQNNVLVNSVSWSLDEPNPVVKFMEVL